MGGKLRWHYSSEPANVPEAWVAEAIVVDSKAQALTLSGVRNQQGLFAKALDGVGLLRSIALQYLQRISRARGINLTKKLVSYQIAFWKHI